MSSVVLFSYVFTFLLIVLLLKNASSMELVLLAMDPTRCTSCLVHCTANRHRAITNRHDLIVGAVIAAANRAGAPSGNEPSLHRHDPNAHHIRPDNYSHFPDGTFTLCDVSVTHAGAPSHRKNPLCEGG